jgi:hypothetical protein
MEFTINTINNNAIHEEHIEEYIDEDDGEDNIIDDQLDITVINQDLPPEPGKKKRGRKPKNANAANAIEEKKPELKKRGRKPTNKLCEKVPAEVLKNETYDECVIVSLPLNKNDIASILNSIKNETTEYGIFNSLIFSSISSGEKGIP